MSESKGQHDRPAGVLHAPCRPRWISGLLLAVIFLSGMAAGWGVSMLVPGGSGSSGKSWRNAKSVDDIVELRLAKYRKELDLSPEQATKVHAVLRKLMKPYYETMLAERMPTMERLNAQLVREISAVLTESQRADFVKMSEERMSRWRKMAGGLPSTAPAGR